MSCVASESAYWRNIFLQRYKDTNTISKFLIAEFVTFPFLLVGEKQGRDCCMTPLWSTKLFLISWERAYQSLVYKKSWKGHLINLAPICSQGWWSFSSLCQRIAQAAYVQWCPSSTCCADVVCTPTEFILDFLCFVTGSRSSTSMFVPGSIGLSIGNTESIFASTCTLELKLPSSFLTYSQFESAMKAVLNVQGKKYTTV